MTQADTSQVRALTFDVRANDFEDLATKLGA